MKSKRPPVVADDPGWTSSTKEYNRMKRMPPVPRPPESPGWSSAEKDYMVVRQRHWFLRFIDCLKR